MTFKCLNGLAQAYLRSKFIVRADVHSLNTRHRNKLDECTATKNSYRPAVVCIHTEPLGFRMNYLAGLKNDCACVKRGAFRSFDQWKVRRWTRPFPGNVCLQDGTERRSLWTFSVNGNSLTCWKDSRGMFVYLDSLKPADKFLKASLLCGNDGRSWWVGLIDFIHFKNIIELLSSELSMDVTW